MDQARSRTSIRRADSGVVLLALLIALLLGGIALMAAAEVESVARQRAREQELLFVGDQYRRAVLRYYLGAPPGTRRMLPSKLEDLLDDDRYPMPVHHLRRLYPDPINGSTDWGLLRAADRIFGVYSQSDKQPLKQAGFDAKDQRFNGAMSYRDWVFAVAIRGVTPVADPKPPGQPASAPLPLFDPTR